MRSAPLALVLGNLALALAVAGTFGTDVGWERRHHDLAYALLALAALAAWPLLRRRRLATLLLASLAAWSTLTGLFLVYVTPGMGHGRWMSWWHGATSVGFLLAFLAHWARNQPRLAGLVGALARRRAALAAFAGAWALVALAGVASVRTPLRALFDDEVFADLTTLSFLAAGLGALYGGIVLTSRRFRARLADPPWRNRVRGAVDASLLGTTWLVALTGFPLLYFARDLRALDAYWLVAGWHVVTGALLLGLVAFHAGFNARPLAAHAAGRSR